MIAAHFGLRTAKVLHYWITSYDRDYSRYSPGLILLLRLAEQAAAMGVETLDLGKGDAQYKQRLMSGAHRVSDGILTFSPLCARYPASRSRRMGRAQGFARRRYAAFATEGDTEKLRLNWCVRAQGPLLPDVREDR